MNLKQSDDQENNWQKKWLINGIKYAIFKRISPGISHDLVGPLSVALIQAGIIKRKLKADHFQASELLDNAVNLESYIKQTVLLMRATKNWDAANTPIFDVENVKKQCIKFFQTRLAMRGIDLTLVENNHAHVQIKSFQAFLYSWLALLCYLEDSLTMPAELQVEQIAENAISVLVKEKQPLTAEIAGKSIIEMPNRLENLTEDLIGHQELLVISQHYATTFTFDKHQILFKW